ncbi:aldose epimerase family protein [Streptomyces sp. CB03911]|uniref:aldose epimerase family protein n=1 Tax=Streptomyces sp. CB03911 TaxID=1804758 RepID=UPI00093AB8B5|nr:aldose epimerase family protein [Streptomyces sp. CB03911]OKI19865.1 galactose mutarotase [Streptomyces sp. CB03911]
MPQPVPHREPFGRTPDGRPVDLWRLESASGVSAEILTYGGVLHRLSVPDTAGRSRSVVLSLPDVPAYAAHSPYFGALVGRFANRIAGGRFSIDGRPYRVPANDHGHALHGGPEGFHSRLWQAEPAGDRAEVELSLLSPDGDMGFPGALSVRARYALDEAGTLSVTFEALCDRPTVVNLTNHAYFNLGGAGSGDVLGHLVEVDGHEFLPVAPDAIPFGPPQAVAGTPFDLTRARPVGEALAVEDQQVKNAGGFDHCWVLRPAAEPGALRPAARLSDPVSGRALEVWTTEPGLQVYTANQLDGTLADAEGHHHPRHGGICLETQHLPDSPNRPEYPSTVLRPGERFTSRTEFRFPHLPTAPA